MQPSKNIWQTLPKNFLALAPMEGITDPVFRQVIAKAARPDLFFTEFTNVSSFASEKGRANALERLEITPTDPPIIAQIWGKNPDHFAMLATELKSLGFSGLDINMGCPDRHVNKAGGGAAMIRTPDLALQCIAQARAATGLPISVKTRLGFTSVEEFPTWLSLLLKQNLDALTVHLRTRKEMSKVPAHFELIPDILKLRANIAPGTKLIINGDIRDRAHAETLAIKFPDIDGFMIGRGVFQNPFCFAPTIFPDLNNTLIGTKNSPTPIKKSPDKTTPSSNYTTDRIKSQAFKQKISSPSASTPVKIQPLPTKSALLSLLHYHLDLYDDYAAQLESRGSRYPFEPLKHFFKIYINNFPGASDLRARLMACTNTTEVRATLAQETS